jgi:hypothetical protein
MAAAVANFVAGGASGKDPVVTLVAALGLGSEAGLSTGLSTGFITVLGADLSSGAALVAGAVLAAALAAGFGFLIAEISISFPVVG